MSEIFKPTAEIEPENEHALVTFLLPETPDLPSEATSMQLLHKEAAQLMLPLSASQQSLWFLYKLAPQSWAYNVSFAFRICSPLNIPVLRWALQALVDRHPSLRTTYTTLNNRLVQQVHEQLKVHFEETDASAWSQNFLNNRLTQEARRPFDLERGPILRVNLFAQSATEHILLLTMHHIAVDFWSLTVLLDELRVLYSAQNAGAQISLAPLDLQYADYVRWQAEMLAGKEGERLWNYWHKQLAGELPVLNLPTDKPRPSVQTYRGESHAFELSTQLTQQLKARAKAESVTLYMLLLAAFQVLLYRYSGQEDILVGSPTTGRSRREFSDIVGNFINPVVLRGDLSGNPTFKAFLTQVRHTVIAALEHQEYPFTLLVERLHLNHNSSQSPLFQAMLILRRLHRFEELSEFLVPDETKSCIDFGGLSVEPFVLAQQEGVFDLTLEMIETGGSLKGILKYNPDLFEARSVHRMVGHFQTLLEGVVADSNQPISTLPLLTAAEQHQLIVEWNNTQSVYPLSCIHEVFEAAVKQTPEAIAVVFGAIQLTKLESRPSPGDMSCRAGSRDCRKEAFGPGETAHATQFHSGVSLTYQELNCRANKVAHYLQALGVGPDVFVGICMERSLSMVIGILGILKAGGVYVPLDPTYPPERLMFMLEDTQTSVLLTQQHLVESLPKHSAKVICLDTDWKSIATESEENPSSGVTAENLAYIMYTSGSTGQPKGVSVIHQSVVRLVRGVNYANLNSEEVFLQLAPISFDASTFEIWGSLLNGAKLVIFPAHTPTPKELGQFIQHHQITTLWLTAGLFHLMVDERLEDLKHVRQILAGGDVLSVPHVNMVLQLGCKLINGYGPTENTTFTCCYPMTAHTQVGTCVPIGRPIANTQIYLLDAHLQPVPIGVPGELYIGGDGLARGYLNRPELTAERFIPNPLSDLRLGKADNKTKSERLYRTGDLARYLSDGNIEFLGRIDNQIKLRGFRIELGEIEAALLQHPAVREAVVLAWEDIKGDKRLIAYVVFHQERSLTQAELRRFLKLPEYMIPSVFVTLDTLPLTPNGKVDRRALPSLGEIAQEPEETFVAPRNELELQLTKIWGDVLNIQPISVRDSFFELGGHSLLAVRLLSAIEQEFDTNLPLAALFEAPTIEQLANILRSQGCNAPIESIVPLQPKGHKEPLFCIYGILLYHELARNLGTDRPVYGVYIQDEVDLLKAGRLKGQTALMSVAHLATRYLKEIRTLQPVGPYFLAGESFGGLVAFEMAQQLHLQGEKVALVALFDTYTPGGIKKLLFWERVFLHLRHLSQEGAKYALEKVGRRLDSSKDKLAMIMSRVYKKFENFQRPLPNYLQRAANRDIRQQIIEQAIKNYVPQPYSGKVILFRAKSRSKFEAYYTDPQLEWSKLAASGLDVYDVPGDHISILQEPNVRVLAEKLRACVDSAQEDI